VDAPKKNLVRSLPGQGSEFGTRAELMAIAPRLREENIALNRELKALQERCQSLESSRADGVRELEL
jgi:hypothetical protein